MLGLIHRIWGRQGGGYGQVWLAAAALSAATWAFTAEVTHTRSPENALRQT